MVQSLSPGLLCWGHEVSRVMWWVGSLVTSKKGDRLCLGRQLEEFIWLHWILRPRPQPWPGQQEGTQRTPAPDDPQGRGIQALSPGAGATVAGLGQKCW